MRPAVALLAAFAAVAAPATLAAQMAQGPGVSAWALGFQYDEGWELGAQDENRKVDGNVVASARKGSAYAHASATPSSGQLKGAAYSGHWRDVGMSGASIAQYVTITNHSEDTRYYGFDMYLHARGYGQCQVAFRCPQQQPVASAVFRMEASFADDAGRPTWHAGSGVVGANVWTNGWRGVNQEFFEEGTGAIRVPPGTSRYLVEFLISFEAIAGFSIVGEQTATIFMPARAGFSLSAEGEFLDRQARPDWSTTTAPEPATLALLGTGLAMVAGVRARRGRRSARGRINV
jgi:hypothetical protein